MIQVSIPAEIPLKDFPYNAEVELIEPVVDTVASPTFQGAVVNWYIKALNADPLLVIYMQLCCFFYLI